MKYLLVEKLLPDTQLNPSAIPGTDKLTWTSPYLGIRQQIENSIAKGYQSRYYTENDTLVPDPETGNWVLTREFLSLEGAQDMKTFLEAKAAPFGSESKILEIYINQIADDGTVTRID
jgi:hypothetical protein